MAWEIKSESTFGTVRNDHFSPLLPEGTPKGIVRGGAESPHRWGLLGAPVAPPSKLCASTLFDRVDIGFFGSTLLVTCKCQRRDSRNSFKVSSSAVRRSMH
ncbi:MAG: hypothetical protein CNCCGFBP_00206 [Fimbriimonadaceae bacterium]|nr:hypothetical protein [Fimbriimonadaceae bacterium]